MSEVKFVIWNVSYCNIGFLFSPNPRQSHWWPAWPRASCCLRQTQMWSSPWSDPAPLPNQHAWHTLPSWWPSRQLQHHQVQAVLHHLVIWGYWCWGDWCNYWCHKHGVSWAFLSFFCKLILHTVELFIYKTPNIKKWGEEEKNKYWK